MNAAITFPGEELSPLIQRHRKIFGQYLPYCMEILETRLLFHGLGGIPVPVPSPYTKNTTLLLIDKSLVDASLLSESMPDSQTLYFDSATESATNVLKRAIRAAKAFHGRLQSIVIFSHGAPGEFELGRDLVSSTTLAAESDLWTTLGKQIASSGSIDLFACSLASSSAGLILINQLHALTNANIFASTNVTGKDGDWILEAHSAGAAVSEIPSLNTTLLSTYPSDLGVVGIQNMASANPNPVTGTTTALSVLASDTTGESHVTYSWAATIVPPGATPTFSINNSNAAKNTTVTFNLSGTYEFTVTASDGALFALSTVTVIVDPTPTTITVSPASASLNENGTQLFTAEAFDQFNQAITLSTFTWSVDPGGVGSIDIAGLYSAGTTPGTATVRATDEGASGTSAVTVTNAAPTVLVPATAAPNPVDTTNTTLSVLATDDGGLTNLTYTWAATSEPPGANPAFSSNGTNLSSTTVVTFNEAGNYTFTVNISDGSSSSLSSVNVTVDQLLTSVSVSPATVDVAPNATQQFTATALDQFNNPMASQPTFTWSLVPLSDGSISSTGLYTAPDSTGSATVLATDLPYLGTASVTVDNSPPTIVTPASANPNPVDESSTTLSVLADDDGGTSNLTYTWAATSAPTGANPTFSANGTNLSSITVATFNEAGDYIFTVTVSNGSSDTTSSVDVTVDQTLTTITVSPASVNLAPNSTQQFTATAFDQFGNALATQPAFTWSVDPPGAGTIDSNGLYTAPASSDFATIRATADLIYSGTASATTTNSPPTILIPASANPNPVTDTDTTLGVLADDDGGETNLTYTWSASSAPPGANPTFSANGTNLSSTTRVTFNEAGDYIFTVTVSDGSLNTTSSVNVTVDQTLSSVSVSPATVNLAPNATQQFTATALDQFNNPLATQPAFTWSLAPLSDGTINSTGIYTAPASTGSATILATDLPYAGTASATVNNTPPTILLPTSANPNPVNTTSTTLSVLAADDGGAANLTYTWAATAAPPGATPTFGSNGSNLSSTTIATFNEAGDYTFTVTVSDGSLDTTSSVNVTVDQALTTVSVSPATVNIVPNATQQFTATAFDQFNNPLATQPTFTWSLAPLSDGTINSTGLYTAPDSAGSATVLATNLPYVGTASVTVDNSPPTIITPASANPNPVDGTSTILSVLAADDGGAANLTYTWAATSAPLGANPTFSANGTNSSQITTVTFNQAGTYTFTVTVFDGSLDTTSSVNVTVNQTLTSITVSPSSVILSPDATQLFTATALDQFSNALSTQPTFTWSIDPLGAGTIDSNGLYTAPASSGSATIRATADLIYSGTASVTVNNSPPNILVPASASPNPVTGTNTTLTVLANDDGGETNLTYTWTTTTSPAGSNPIFSANGTNQSQTTTVTFDQAGNYIFTVIVSDGSLTTTSSVDVAVNQTLTSVIVTPQSANLAPDSIQQFSATALDQFGNPLISSPSFTWSLASLSPGRINANGFYTAPAFSSAATIIATADAIFSGSANVIITNTAPTVILPASADPNPVAGLHTTLSVLGDDDGGETNLTYSWAATNEPVGANPTFSSNNTNASKVIVVLFDMAGAYTFTATISDGSLSTTSSVHVLVTQTMSELVVSPSSAQLSPDSHQQFTAHSFDQFGNPMFTPPDPVWSLDPLSVGTINSDGQYIAPAFSGRAIIRASADLLTATAAVSISNQPPVILIPASANPDPVTGFTTALSALASDDGGDNNLTYAWSTTVAPENAAPVFSINGTNPSSNTIVTFNSAGNYVFTVTVSDGSLSITSSVAVTVVQTLSNLVISPASVSLAAGTAQQFTTTAFDQFGNAMTAQPNVAWAVDPQGFGSIDTNGFYTAPEKAGQATIRADAGSGITAAASAAVSAQTEVTPPPPSPPPPTTVISQPPPTPQPSPAPAPGTSSPSPVVFLSSGLIAAPRAVQAATAIQTVALPALSVVFSLDSFRESKSPGRVTFHTVEENAALYRPRTFTLRGYQKKLPRNVDLPFERVGPLISLSNPHWTSQALIGTSAAITAGIIAELLIPGSLLAGLFASTPAWRWFDPVAISSASRRLRQTENGWTLEKLLQ